MTQASRITVIGSINMDMTSRVVELPKAGETILATSFDMRLGGKGSNQAIAASRLGLPVAIAGCIGDDAFGKYARQVLETNALDLSGLYVNKDVMTGVASININKNGENTIVFAGGANMTMTADDVQCFKDVIISASVVMMQLEVPVEAILEAAKLARDAGKYVMLDPAPAPDILPQSLYRLAHIMTPNETETEKLTHIRPIDKQSAKRAAEILWARGLETAVIKLGGQGTCYFSKEEQGFMPPFKVDMVDSVAAGDSFNAGLATGLAKGLPLRDSVRLAAACGALATTKQGSSDAAPYLKEAEDLIAEQSHIVIENIV